jgi:hypothetical protein
MEMASATWNDVQPKEADPTARHDPRRAASPVASPAASVVEPAPLFSATPSEVQGDRASVSAVAAVPPAAADVADAASLPAGVADRLPPLFSRLEALGVTDPQLAPWGLSGQMYRFCCRASWAGTPAFTRHFEAVAAEPLSAVEQVVAKVEAWRNIQHDETAVR